MTISSTIARVSFSGDGTTTSFSFPYDVLSASDLIVILRAVDNSETTKVLTTDYNFTGTAVNGTYPNGGSVVMNSAPLSGQFLTIIRDPSPVQDLHLVNNSILPVDQVELRLDKLTMFTQRLKDIVSRSIQITDGLTGSWRPNLPTVLTPGAILAIDTDGLGFQLGPIISDVTGASASAAAAAASAAAAAASATASATSAAQLPIGITGTRASPQAIIAGTGIAFAGTQRDNIWFVTGTGGVTITANPAIAAGSFVGQRLTVVGRDDSNKLTIPNGLGTSQNGDAVLGQDSTIEYMWDGSAWREDNRNDL